jgi:SAM-dependent methyltransferase
MADSTPPGPYSPQFYERHSERTSCSAAAVVPIVMNLIHPASVVDIGCGIGQWLGAFRAAGVRNVLGIDGAHVDRKMLLFPPEFFREADLEKPFRIPERFDLACSLEVAEHLTAPAGAALVAALCAAAPVVMFSAAVPLQGGDDHVNEQWPSYWIKLFEARGFRMFDALRPQILTDRRITYFYRQNLMMFASDEGAAAHPALAAYSGPFGNLGLEWVHASVHEAELTDLATLMRAPAALRRKIRRVARRIVRRLLRLHEST